MTNFNFIMNAAYWIDGCIAGKIEQFDWQSKNIVAAYHDNLEDRTVFKDTDGVKYLVKSWKTEPIEEGGWNI